MISAETLTFPPYASGFILAAGVDGLEPPAVYVLLDLPGCVRHLARYLPAFAVPVPALKRN